MLVLGIWYGSAKLSTGYGAGGTGTRDMVLVLVLGYGTGGAGTRVWNVGILN